MIFSAFVLFHFGEFFQMLNNFVPVSSSSMRRHLKVVQMGNFDPLIFWLDATISTVSAFETTRGSQGESSVKTTDVSTVSPQARPLLSFGRFLVISFQLIFFFRVIKHLSMGLCPSQHSKVSFVDRRKLFVPYCLFSHTIVGSHFMHCVYHYRISETLQRRRPYVWNSRGRKVFLR